VKSGCVSTPVDSGDSGASIEEATRVRVSVTPVSWASEEPLDFKDWVEQGRRLGIMGRGIGWWLGDWLNYGNALYGERYVRAARITGYDVQTLMNMAYVASHYEVPRRRQKLSWSHHAEVAAVDKEEQERWLDLAERERLSVRCLRVELRVARRSVRAPEGEPASANRNGDEPAADEHGSDTSEVVCPACGERFALMNGELPVAPLPPADEGNGAPAGVLVSAG
jgi:hypothetical protein